MRRGFIQHHLSKFSEIRKQILLIANGTGVTLIELLIVIALIGVLAAGIITIINPLTQFQKANDARRKSNLNQIQKALEQYYQDYGYYPDSTAEYKIERPDGSAAADWGTSQWAPYMSVLPIDPASSKKYVYYSTANGQTYYIYASLDRGANDPQVCTGTDNACSADGSINMQTACGGICNYGISSPNVSP